MTQMAVVTGAAGAMGPACASALSPIVDQLLLTDCDARGLDAVTARLSDAGPAKVVVVVGDIGDIGDAGYAPELVATAATLGTLRPLIHTAEVSPSIASWRDILRIDLTGSDRLLGVLAEHVAPGTTAVCLASVSGLMGNFDPAMDAILDYPLDPEFAERFRSQFPDGRTPDPRTDWQNEE